MSHGAYVEDLTKLLNAAGDGDTAALDRAWRSIHAEIHEMAERACNAEGTRAQLQPTLLVNELFLKMYGPGVTPTTWDDRRHFWGSVGRALGQFLIDLARSEGRLRRGGNRVRVPIEVVAGELEDVTRALSPLSIVALEALDRLELESPESAEVARMRFLSGFSIEQTAILLDIAPRTVSKRWNYARAWLRRAIAEST
ncbi:MAG: ECF-type sigma factor [Planctomycetota bacterium]|nr:ECF-type sigma factor [Planctomycetota bacterium]